MKNKDIKSAIESFGTAMASSGKNLEEEVQWVGERGLELMLDVRVANLTAIWFYFSLFLGSQGNEQLNHLSQAQGLISLDNLILRTVIGRVFNTLQKSGKIPSRNLAILMVALDNGIKELENLVKDSLQKFIPTAAPKEQPITESSGKEESSQQPEEKKTSEGDSSE
ncbi:MAG: hypothetical protein LUQ65_06015 [Candidatus Helarchaeota archaeon]|nr:hypothetical protein [Candidatus Helarchaeota archaeon]